MNHHYQKDLLTTDIPRNFNNITMNKEKLAFSEFETERFGGTRETSHIIATLKCSPKQAQATAKVSTYYQ